MSWLFQCAEVQNFLKVDNVEMDSRGVDEAMRLEYFCRVVAELIYEEIKELREAHDSWVTFKKALLEVYIYERPKGRGWREFDQWVTSAKTHQRGTQGFLDFVVFLLNSRSGSKDWWGWGRYSCS